MDKIKIKNKGNPVFIGTTLCLGGGAKTQVDVKDLEVFGANQAGAFLLSSTITVYDEDLKRKRAMELDQAKSQAEAKVRLEFAPVLEKEIRAKLDKEYASRIEDLEDQISHLDDDVDILNRTIAELKKGKAPAKKAENKEFVLDPERHHIEHRGAGKWFVMDQEEKVYGPLTDAEMIDFEERLKAD